VKIDDKLQFINFKDFSKTKCELKQFINKQNEESDIQKLIKYRCVPPFNNIIKWLRLINVGEE